MYFSVSPENLWVYPKRLSCENPCTEDKYTILLRSPLYRSVHRGAAGCRAKANLSQVPATMTPCSRNRDLFHMTLPTVIPRQPRIGLRTRTGRASTRSSSRSTRSSAPTIPRSLFRDLPLGAEPSPGHEVPTAVTAPRVWTPRRGHRVHRAAEAQLDSPPHNPPGRQGFVPL